MKARPRNSASGSSGVAARSSTRQNATSASTPTASEAEDLRRRDAVLAHGREREHQPGDAERERDASGQVEADAMPRRLAQHGVGEREGEQREACLHREYDAPPEPVHERAPDGEPECGCARRGHRPPAHRAHALLARRHAEDQRHRGRLRGSTERRGERAHPDQRERAPRETGGDRRQRGGGGPEQEHAPVPAQVAELAEQREGDGGDQHRRRDDPRHRRLARAELRGDRRERDGQDRDREGRGEHPGERRPAAPRSGACRAFRGARPGARATAGAGGGR